MFTLTSHSKSTIVAIVLVVTLLLGNFAFAQRTEAQSTREAMLAQISQLLQIVLALQAQLAAMDNSGNTGSLEGGFDSRNIAVGDSVKTTDTLKVRNLPTSEGHNFFTQPAGITGTVVGGPRYSDGYTWWQISYSNNVMGWSAENWLQLIGTSARTLSGLKMKIEPYNQSKVEFEAIFDFADWTSYTFEIDWGEGDASKQTIYSRVVTVCNSAWTCSGPAGQLHKYSKSGSYTVKLFALIPNVGGGTTRTLVESESVHVEEADDSEATCSIATDKSVYYLGEDIEIEWTSNNAEYLRFTDFSPKDTLDLPLSNQDSSDSIEVEADVIGRPLLELTAYDEDGGKNTCSRRIEIKDQDLRLTANHSLTDEYTMEPDARVDFFYYPKGYVEECVVTLRSSDEDLELTHEWNGDLVSSDTQFGRFSGYGVTSRGTLEEVEVVCDMQFGIENESINIDVVATGERGTLEIELNGQEVYSQSGITESEAMANCRVEVNNHNFADDFSSSDNMECFWEGESILYNDGWKG